MRGLLALAAIGVVAALALVWSAAARRSAPAAPRAPAASTSDETAGEPARAPALAPPADTTGDATTIFGRVVDALGSPLRNCEVVVQSAGDVVPIPAPEPTATALARMRTDADGRFTVRHRAGGRGFVSIAHPEFPPQIAGEVELLPSRSIDLGDLVLRSQPGLRVEVRAAGTELPVAAARVELAPAIDDAMLPGHPLALRRRLAQTDAAGLATLLGVEAGAYSLRVEAPGFAVHEGSHELAPAELPETIRVALHAGGILRGRVRAGAEPVAGALLQALPLPDGPLISARTNEHGEFRLQGLAERSYRLEVLSRRHGRLHLPRLDVTRDPAPLDLDFGRGELLHGRTLGPDGRPLAGVELTAEPEPGSVELPGALARASSAADGTFSMAGLAPVRHRLKARATGLPEQEFGPFAPGSAALELRLTAGLRVTGRVLDPFGRPVAGAVVLLAAPEHDGSDFASFLDRVRGSPAAVRSAADGRFEFLGVEPRPWRVVARATGEAPGASPALPVPPDGWVEAGPILLPRGARVHGRARRADGSPAAQARICLDPVPDPAAPWRDAATATADAGGQFEIGPAAPGIYELSFHAPGTGAAGAAADLRQRTKVRIRLEPGVAFAQDLQERPR
jgi:protocatechuate 3,4-dioxygenase beta subunit